MDSITHILSAALATEPIRPQIEAPRYAKWRERLVILLVALLPDADGLLGAIDLALFAKYHRVVSHSLVCMVALAFLCAIIAQRYPERWLLPSMRPNRADGPIAEPSYRRLLLFAGIGLTMHLIGDGIAQWGLWPMWPFSHHDVSLGRVNSLDFTLCMMTLVGFALQTIALRAGRRRTGWAVFAMWVLACGLYVWLRPMFGEPAFV